MFQNVLVFAPVTKRQATNIQLLIIKLGAVDELDSHKKHRSQTFNLTLWKLFDDDDEVYRVNKQQTFIWCWNSIQFERTSCTDQGGGNKINKLTSLFAYSW